jgi:hypothetical protein
MKAASSAWTFVLLQIGMAAAAILLAGKWETQHTIRYFTPYVMMGPLALVAGLQVFFGRIFFRATDPPWKDPSIGPALVLGILALLLSTSMVVARAPALVQMHFRFPYPEEIACVDRHARRISAQRGWAHEDGAARIMGMSQANLRIHPLESDGQVTNRKRNRHWDRLLPESTKEPFW